MNDQICMAIRIVAADQTLLEDRIAVLSKNDSMTDLRSCLECAIVRGRLAYFSALMCHAP